MNTWIQKRKRKLLPQAFGFFHSVPVPFKGTCPKNLINYSPIVSQWNDLKSYLFMKVTHSIELSFWKDIHTSPSRLPLMPIDTALLVWQDVFMHFLWNSSCGDPGLQTGYCGLSRNRHKGLCKRICLCHSCKGVRTCCSFGSLAAADLSHCLIHFPRQTLPTPSTQRHINHSCQIAVPLFVVLGVCSFSAHSTSNFSSTCGTRSLSAHPWKGDVGTWSCLQHWFPTWHFLQPRWQPCWEKPNSQTALCSWKHHFSMLCPLSALRTSDGISAKAASAATAISWVKTALWKWHFFFFLQL